MQVKKEKEQGLRHEYTVTIPAKDLDAHKTARLKEIGKTARLPGFRPGKAPAQVLEQKYGDSILGEVVEKAVNDGTTQAITEAKLRPAGQPSINIKSFSKGEDLVFSLVVETLPEFKVMDVKGIKLEKPVAKVDDSAIEDAINRIAKQSRTNKPVETKRAAKMGDVVVIDFEGVAEGGLALPGMKGEGVSLELGSKSFIEGYEEQLVGKKAGETVEVDVTFPDPYGEPKLAGKKAKFVTTIQELREPVDAEINDDFAKKLGADDLTMLKKAIRDQMSGDYNQYSRMKVKRALFDVLDEKHQFDLPQNMVDAEFKTILNQIEHERHGHAHGDHDHDHDHHDHTHVSDEEREELKGIAARRVRLGLILSEIGTANNITVSDQDLQKEVMNQARRYPGQEAQVFEMFRKNKQLIEQLRAPIFEEKVVDFILELADVKEKEVPLAELTADDDEDEAPKAKKAASKSKAKADDAEEKPKKAAAKKK